MCEHVLITQLESLIQKILHRLDSSTKMNILNTINEFTSNVLSIFSAILLLPVNDDIICIIISNIFTHLKGPTRYHTFINKKWALFCSSFGKTCNYVTKHVVQDNIMKKLMNHFITTKMDSFVNIMCASKMFTIFILFNEYYYINFTFLAFDNESDNVVMSPFDVSHEHDCKNHEHLICPYYELTSSYYFHDNVDRIPFNFNKMYHCDDIYYSDDNMFNLSKSRKNLLISKIIKVLSKKFKHRHLGYGNINLFH